jgi:cellulose synthase/poly-beta-1,6-N-acetylglucosamine synthase-like glycosyltransferase
VIELSPGMQTALEIAAVIIITYFVVLNGSYIATSIIAFRALRRYRERLQVLAFDEMGAADVPGITLVGPAYNEEATCVAAVQALLTLRYPDYEIVIVNDGSKDKTLATLIEAYDMKPADRVPNATLATKPVRCVYRSARHPNLWLVDKENGGKADALNAGVNHSRTPLFCAMDSDTLLEPHALTRISRPFLEHRDTIAVGGIIRIVNGCTVKAGIVTDVRLPPTLVPRLQVLEYLRAFLAGRMGWGAINATLIISGAFGLFRRDAVVEVGGFAHDTVGEDMELVVRLHRRFREWKRPYRVAFLPDPVAWTECPESLKILRRQRERWQRGLTEVLTRHRAMLFNPKYGRIGMVAFPYFFFLEMLGPIVEVTGYLIFILDAFILRSLSPVYATAFLTTAILLGVTLSLAAVGLEELSFRRYARLRDLVTLFALSLVENFGYRQLNTAWRFEGLISVLRKKRGWGKMERIGFARPAA